jgi:hypothetical protein
MWKHRSSTHQQPGAVAIPTIAACRLATCATMPAAKMDSTSLSCGQKASLRTSREGVQYFRCFFEDNTDVIIKLRVNGKCITDPCKLPGPTLLNPCVADSQQQQWFFDDDKNTSATKTFALRSKVGGCATIGCSRSTTVYA